MLCLIGSEAATANSDRYKAIQTAIGGAPVVSLESLFLEWKYECPQKARAIFILTTTRVRLAVSAKFCTITPNRDRGRIGVLAQPSIAGNMVRVGGPVADADNRGRRSAMIVTFTEFTLPPSLSCRYVSLCTTVPNTGTKIVRVWAPK